MTQHHFTHGKFGRGDLHPQPIALGPTNLSESAVHLKFSINIRSARESTCLG